MDQKAAIPVDGSNSSSSSSSSREQSPSPPFPQQLDDSKDTTAATPPADGQQSSNSSADSVKEEGLCAFRAGDWRSATDAWSRGLRTLEYILAKEDEFDEDKKKEFLAMQQSYLLNLSLSTLREGRWAACILYCDKALKNDPTALKALYRKAQAQQELGDFDGALTTVDKYLDVSPGSPLALSLQSQLRHQKAAHAVKEKKLLQGMFRNLEHDPRSAASAAASASGPAGMHAQGDRPLQSIGKKIKGWFSRAGGEEVKKDGEQHNIRQQMQESQQQGQQQTVQQLRQQLWNERLAALNGENDSVGKWPFPTAGGAGETGAVAGDIDQQAALREALLALGGTGGAEQSAPGAGLDIEQLARLVQIHQQLSSGNATFKDKFVFGLRLAWFGIRQFCSRGCQYFCRRRQIPRRKTDEFQWEDELPVKAVPSRGAPSEGREGKPFVNRAQRRQQCRTAAAAAARRRMQHQTKCRSKIEDLDELEARER